MCSGPSSNQILLIEYRRQSLTSGDETLRDAFDAGIEAHYVVKHPDDLQGESHDEYPRP